MGPHIGRVVIVTHGDPQVAAPALAEALAVCQTRGVQVVAPAAEIDKHKHLFKSAETGTLTEASTALDGVDLCLVIGGDGTMLRGFHLTRDHAIPVAGVNLGRVGFLTTVDRDDVRDGVSRLLRGEFTEYPLLGLQAEVEGETYRATNDLVVCKGERSNACLLGLTINGVRLFEVQCDGVVAGTPAGSSAYSLAAGGPLLGIAVDAYVISLVAAHAVGVRPVVAAPMDVLEIINNDEHGCYLDVDGQRMRLLDPGCVVCIRTIPGMTSLALLEGDSLYHHFRDRLL
jgi:NAD+ kinase